MPKRERFYVREHSGYPIGYRNAQRFTEVMVIDRDNCHRVIDSTCQMKDVPGVTEEAARHAVGGALGYRRDRAARIAGRLNREHAE